MSNKIIYLLFTVFLIFDLSYSQTTRIAFNYDDAGNQVKREICINCNARPVAPADTLKPALAKIDKQVLQDTEYPEISYYPNPVQEELYIRWSTLNGNKVASIDLYNMSGQLLKKYPDLQKSDEKMVPFRNYPEGFYNLVLSYTDGSKKNLRIIKK